MLYKRPKRAGRHRGQGSPWGGGLGLPARKSFIVHVPTPNPFRFFVSIAVTAILVFAVYLRPVVLPKPTRQSPLFGQLPLHPFAKSLSAGPNCLRPVPKKSFIPNLSFNSPRMSTSSPAQETSRHLSFAGVLLSIISLWLGVLSRSPIAGIAKQASKSAMRNSGVSLLN